MQCLKIWLYYIQFHNGTIYNTKTVVLKGEKQVDVFLTGAVMASQTKFQADIGLKTLV